MLRRERRRGTYSEAVPPGRLPSGSFHSLVPSFGQASDIQGVAAASRSRFALRPSCLSITGAGERRSFSGSFLDPLNCSLGVGLRISVLTSSPDGSYSCWDLGTPALECRVFHPHQCAPSLSAQRGGSP